MKKKIVFIGSRGIPASYSGFETSIQETAVRFVKRGYQVEVYCRSNHFTDHPKEFKGVQLHYLPSIKSKYFDTVTHTALSVLSVLMKKIDFIIIYGVGNSFFIPILQLRRVPIVAVVDGADWERAKWGRFAKWFLSVNRFFAVRCADHYVVDNELLARNYSQRFGKEATYIPYGANEISTYDQRVLERYGVEERRYIIFVGRFVKEKGIDLLIQAFEQVNTDIKLVIVGDNAIDQKYVDYLRSTTDSRIVFTGFLYGGEYESLLHKALFYVSASFLEGTSPSLLSAMAINGFALVSDLPENIEVLKGAGQTFKTGDRNDLIQKMALYISDPHSVEVQREITKEIVNKYYNWDEITKKYESLLQ